MTEEESQVYQKTIQRLQELIEQDKLIQSLEEKLTGGTATYKDAWEYANKVGHAGSRALIEQADQLIAEDIDGYETIMDALYDCYDQSATYAAAVQTLENQKAGIGIKGTQADFDRNRASGIAHLGSNAEDAESAVRALGTPVEHFTENVVGDTIKANEEFQYRSGLNPKIKRTSSGKCCQWCDEIAGVYDYPAPDEVYRRHQNCNCLVEYYPGNGLKQNAHSKRWTADAEPEKITQRINEEEERSRNLHKGKEEVFERKNASEKDYSKARKLDHYTANNLYIEDGVELTPREVRRLNQRINEAKDKLGLIGKCKSPMVITRFSDERKLASYNPRTDTFFIDYRLVVEKDIEKLQRDYVCPDNPLSSLVHELYHWEDADDYRRGVGVIESAGRKSAYTIYQRERAEAALIDAGVNLRDMNQIRRELGDYAYEKMLVNDFEEVYAEYRTKKVLKG